MFLDEVVQWMRQMDYLLKSRLDTDILASDLPEEYKVRSFSFSGHVFLSSAVLFCLANKALP